MEATADRFADAFDPGSVLRPYPLLVPEEWLEETIEGTAEVVRVGACRFPKPCIKSGDAAASPKRPTRNLYFLPGLLEAGAVEELRALAEALSYDDPRVEPVDGRPACMSSVIRAGCYVCSIALERVLRPIIEDKLLPLVRRRFGGQHAQPCTAFIRRYAAPEGRPCLQPHFDSNAVVTINVGITDATEFQGGMYVQPTADAASRVQVPLGKGDVLLHSYDLLHGVSVVQGVRHSLIIWLRDSAASCETDACPWYRIDAALGDADAQLNLAEHKRAGTGGVEQDLGMAKSLYEQAASQGHPIAQFKLGILRELIDGDVQEALTWWRLAAEQGYAKAQRRLAQHEEPKRWLLAAALQDDYLAMYDMYGRLVRNKDERELLGGPLKWLVRAARCGNARAQFDFGYQLLETADVAGPAGNHSGSAARGPSRRSSIKAALGWFLRAHEGGDQRTRALLMGLLARPVASVAGLEAALQAYSRLSAGHPPVSGAELADVAWAGGVCSLPQAVKAAMEGLRSYKPWHVDALVCVAWACSRCEMRDETTLEAMTNALVGACGYLDEIGTQQLSTLLWSLATLSVRLPEPVQEALLAPLVPRLSLLAPPALARLAWALVTLPGVRLHAALREALAAAATHCARELCAEDLSNLAWAMARLGAGAVQQGQPRRPLRSAFAECPGALPRIMQACALRLLEAAGECALQFGLHELTNISWALAELGAGGVAPCDVAVGHLLTAAKLLTSDQAVTETPATCSLLETSLARLRAGTEPEGDDSDGAELDVDPREQVFSICWSDRCTGIKAFLEGLFAAEQK